MQTRGGQLARVGIALVLLWSGLPGVAFSQEVPAPASSTRPLFAEPAAIARGIDIVIRTLGDGTDEKNGLYADLGNMITGAGWISGGPGYRHWFGGDRLLVDGSAAVSWRAYRMMQARVELGHLAKSRLAIGAQARWQDLTQVTYFGGGSDSLESNRSEYRLRSGNVAGYATLRPTRWLAITERVGWLDRPLITEPAGTFKRGNPYTYEVFPGDPAFSVPAQPSFVYQEISTTVDTRDHRSYPTSGGLYRGALARYIDQDSGAFNMTRTEVEAAHFVPVARSPVVLAIHGWLAASDTTDEGWVPFYLQPSLGGHNTVRGYTDYRFHDRNMLVVNLEARIALFTHLDAAVFADAGNVGPRVSDLNLDKRSYGIGWRLHSRESTFARFDIAHGDEGWNVLFRLSDPLHLSRVSRRTAPVPFVP